MARAPFIPAKSRAADDSSRSATGSLSGNREIGANAHWLLFPRIASTAMGHEGKRQDRLQTDRFLSTCGEIDFKPLDFPVLEVRLTSDRKNSQNLISDRLQTAGFLRS